MKKLWLLALGITTFFVAYGVSARAYPIPYPYGRAPYHGYFTNQQDFFGTFVLPNLYGGEAFPNSVNNASAFTNFILSNLGGNAQQRTGASFIIQTMSGSSRNRPPTLAERNAWVNLVNGYAAQGRIQWFTNFAYNLNSYYQGPTGGGPTDDDAFYDNSGVGVAIVFTNPDGTHYAIRRHCANPIGNPSPLQNLSNFSISGSTTVSNTAPKPGQTTTFQYFVRNNGPTATTPADVWWRAVNSLNGATIAGGDSGQYGAGQQKLVYTENYVVPAGTLAGTQICRQTAYAPISSANSGTGYGPPVCAVVPYDFGLSPSVNIFVNGTALAAGSVVEVGDKVDFKYAVANNSGTTNSQVATCTINGKSRPGYQPDPVPPDTTSDPGYVPPATSCPQSFPAAPSNTTIATETIAAIAPTDVNKTICRSLAVSPKSPTGGTASVVGCIRVAAKPYFRTYGGDILAGSGFGTVAAPSSCTNNLNAAIVGWNKEGAGGYAGAGVQYAAFALSRINDVATALGGGAAPTPSGLAFANTSVSGGNFGGLFGTVPCIRDYYGNKPATTVLPGANINLPTVASGAYTATGPLTVFGNIVPGRQIELYVQNDVLITGNITYPVNWTAGNMPLFELVVKGNVYISQNVTRLDGVYIAQPSGAAGGAIYTCANPALPATAIPTTGGSVYSSCQNQLVVNGEFVASQVQLLRSKGTLQQSAAGEPNSSANIGEVFNFTPATWMAQPPDASGALSGYDAITSLPPIL